MNKEKFVWATDIDTILEVYELAKKNGKKAGDSVEKEFLEIMKKKNMKPIIKTDQDIDMMSGNLREKGFKVINIKEIERRKKKNKK